ncbi:MAG TPA: SDR family NAD(P)-dependent oxidoreductase, partial [Chloroflexi bacterium]|nr:SDR family NAD(P)-dependent oxidoreductase [Chloroflexota bacterium]
MEEVQLDASGKVALITGGAVRVGRALTLALAELGAHVIINYRRSAAAAQETAAAARAYGVEALPIQADLGDPEAVAALVTQGQEAFGGVDILINSASPFVRGGLQ